MVADAGHRVGQCNAGYLVPKQVEFLLRLHIVKYYAVVRRRFLVHGGPDFVVEDVLLNHLARVFGAVDLQALLLPDVVSQHRQVFYVVEVPVAYENRINGELLVQRERRS